MTIKTCMLLVIQAIFGDPMASSEEEGEIIPGCINNYYFINDKSEPVSLSILPLLWRTDEIKCHLETKVYLRGASSDGLQEIYKQIIAWKFDLSYAQPIISVLSRDKNWITLERPRKNFESTIRTLLVTIYFLFFVRRNPWEFRMSVWKHIVKVFRYAFYLSLCRCLIPCLLF